MSPYCTYCGKEIKATWKVCTSCGKPIKKSSPKMQLESKPQQALLDLFGYQDFFSTLEDTWPTYLETCKNGVEYLKTNGFYLYVLLPTPKELLENLERSFQQGDVSQAQYNESKKIFVKMVANQKADLKSKIIKIPPGFEPKDTLSRPLKLKTQDGDEIQLTTEFMDRFELSTQMDLNRMIRNSSIILTNFTGPLEKDNFKLHHDRLKKWIRENARKDVPEYQGLPDLIISLMILNSLMPAKGNLSTEEFFYAGCILGAYYKLFPIYD